MEMSFGGNRGQRPLSLSLYQIGPCLITALINHFQIIKLALPLLSQHLELRMSSLTRQYIDTALSCEQCRANAEPSAHCAELQRRHWPTADSAATNQRLGRYVARADRPPSELSDNVWLVVNSTL